MAKFTMTAAEEAELARTCKDPERFHSDGKEVMWACIVVPLLCLPLAAVLWGETHRELLQIQAGEIMIGTGLVFMAPELIGFVALLVLAVAAGVYGVRTWGRHGVAITSFGVARVRGGVKELIRYPEIASLTSGERNAPQHRVITDELEVKAADGRAIRLYGFGLGRRKVLIEGEMERETGIEPATNSLEG